MILRRLAVAVREQNWFTVFVELFLIICGVFLGIQVSNWNEARLDRQLESQVLERLIVDFRDIEADSLSRLSTLARNIEELRSLALQLAEIGEAPDLSLLVGRLRATTAPGLGGGSATYQELLSTGNLGIIRSSTLREALSTFATRQEGSVSSHSLNWNIAINRGGVLMEVTAIAVALEDAMRERELLEAELIKLLRREQDWPLQVSVHISAQRFRHANERSRLARAREVLDELGQEAVGGPAPNVLKDSSDKN